jgi:hypothetical protein
LADAVDKWADSQDDAPTCFEAIRWLTAKARPKQGSRERVRTATAIAANQLDQLADDSATAHEQARRKRRLLKGPEEFQSVRVDRSTKK